MEIRMPETKLLVKDLFKVMSENTTDIIAEFSLDGTIMSINNMAEKLTGNPVESFTGKSVEDFFHTKKAMRQFHGEFRSCCRTGGPCITEIDVTDGKLKGFSFQINFIPIPTEAEDDELAGILVIMRDITSLKRLLAYKEEKIKEQQILSQRLINKANKLQNFSYIISHNLRSPVASLSGLLTLYDQSESEDEKKEILGMISKSVERLSEIVEDLSEVIQINQKVDVKLEQLEFENILRLVRESIELRIQETNTVIKADFRACKRFTYNKAYIESILLNLITNAIKYRHPERSPEIEILTFKRGKDVLLTFRDNGIGVDLKQHGEKIFGLRKTFHGNQDARGVGLFITKNQIEALDGSIKVDSEVGVGTTFSIQFSQKFD